MQREQLVLCIEKVKQQERTWVCYYSLVQQPEIYSLSSVSCLFWGVYTPLLSAFVLLVWLIQPSTTRADHTTRFWQSVSCIS
jgi:hypothetical protein